MTTAEDERLSAIPEVSAALDRECFFVAPIGDEGTEIRRRSDGVLRFIVSRAAEELGLHAIRADEIATPGQITLQVIDHVLRAQAVVADLTGRNPNVFYELAIRHTARLPVALIVDKNDPPLPFDVAQMRVIRFDHTDLESADRCRQEIVSHLREALAGAVDSPIATSIDLRSLASGNQVERNVAELIVRTDKLILEQREATRVARRLETRFRFGPLLDVEVLDVLHDVLGDLQQIQVEMRESNVNHEVVYLMDRVIAALDGRLADQTAKVTRGGPVLRETSSSHPGSRQTQQHPSDEPVVERQSQDYGPRAPAPEAE